MEVELSSGRLADLFPTVGARRGVVIIPDLAGRRPLFEEMASGLCVTHGWNTIVVDPFADLPGGPAGLEERTAAIKRLDDDEVIADLVDAADRLEAEPVAVIGFSIGGMYAFKAAAVHRFDRIASFSGMTRLPSSWRAAGQREPIDLLAHIEERHAVLAIVGTVDPYLPSADVDELVTLGVRVARFEGAGHCFVHDPKDPAHRKGDAAEAWALAVSHLNVARS